MSTVPIPVPVRPRRRPVAAGVALALAGVLLLAACGGDSSPTTTTASRPIGFKDVTPATIRPGDPVPAPTEPVVLTVTGRIGTTNVGDTLQFDMPTLERLGLIEYRIDDKLAEGRVATFTGVPLQNLLDVAKPDAGATTLATTALNDYTVDIPIADASKYPVLLATSVDGRRMPVDRYGPVRVIYPYGAYGLRPPAADEKLIWQLSTIEVR
ncbi:MAG: molybdopterin-dependent oxidoreductase [Microthrixaceae bacterium]